MAFIPMMVENAFSPSYPFRGRRRFRSEHCIPIIADNIFAPSFPFRRRDGFRSGRCRRGEATNLTEDIRNAIAIAQAMFGPENPTHTRSTHQHQSEISEIVDKKKFQANFDVQNFKPEEIIVKVTGDNTVIIEARHEEKQDEHGQIYRHFIRKYVLPENCDVGRLESKLSSDGVLTIMAPIVGTQPVSRAIPIAQTGQPATLAIPAEQKQPEENSDQSAVKPTEQKKPEENPHQSVN